MYLNEQSWRMRRQPGKPESKHEAVAATKYAMQHALLPVCRQWLYRAK